jgi:calcium and integrin-binding protein 1
MGSSASKEVLTKDEVTRYSSSTFFTPGEIRKIYSRFVYLGGTNKNPVTARRIVTMPELRVNPFRFRIVEIFGRRKGDGDEDYVEEAKKAFDDEHGEAEGEGKERAKNKKERPVVNADDVISSADWEEMEFYFNNFVAMLNAFSPRASWQVKAYYAFELYDFDGDHFLNTDDIVSVIETTVGKNRMSRQRMLKIAAQVLEESDLDGNLKISRTEFNRIIRRVPDFTTKFQFSLIEGAH